MIVYANNKAERNGSHPPHIYSEVSRPKMGLYSFCSALLGKVHLSQMLNVSHLQLQSGNNEGGRWVT